MLVERKNNYILISPEENSFLEFYTTFLKSESSYRKEHLIILITEDISNTEEDFLLFLNIAEQKKENGTSFVVVSTNLNIDNFPEHFNIVPTLQEAEDILEMESIERELGF